MRENFGEIIPSSWIKNLDIWNMKGRFNGKDSTFMSLPLLDVLLHLKRITYAIFDHEKELIELVLKIKLESS